MESDTIIYNRNQEQGGLVQSWDIKIGGFRGWTGRGLCTLCQVDETAIRVTV